MTRTLVVALRTVTAALAGAVAGIHLDLWSGHGYRFIPTIGNLFLLNGVAGSLLCIACLVLPRRVLPLAAASTALFAAGTITALVLSVNIGLFGFTESTHAPLLDQSVAVEAAAIAAGVALAALTRPRRQGSIQTKDPDPTPT
jgi:hypothetical protein